MHCVRVVVGKNTRSAMVRKLLSVTRRRVVIVAAILIVVVGFWLFPTEQRWIAIDSCLDLGGRWDYSAGRCEK
jgi:hypothetical protein